jgi:hypothetical protein
VESYPSAQRPDNLAFFVPLEFIEMTPHLSGNIIQPTHDEVQFTLKRFLVSQFLTLHFNRRDALAKPGHTRLECRFVDQSLGITLNETGYALPPLAPLGLQGAPFLPLALARRWWAPFKFGPEALGLGSSGPDFLPYRQFQALRAYLRSGTEPLTAKALRVCPSTAVVSRGTRPVRAGTRAQRLAIEGIAAVMALQQALPPIPRPTARLPRVAAILGERHWNGIKGSWLDQSGNRATKPVLSWQVIRRGGLARVHRFAPRGAEARTQRTWAAFAAGGPAPRGGVFKPLPHHTAVPHRASGPGAFARWQQTTADCTNREALTAHPLEDVTHPPGFLRPHLIAGLAAAMMVAEIAGALRRTARDIHRARARRMQVTAAVALQNLGPFGFRHPALDLPPQVLCRAPAQLAIDTHDLHTQAAQLFHQEDLLGILARQPVGGMPIESVNDPGTHGIPQALQGRTDQRGAPRAIIKQRHRFGPHQTLSLRALPERRHLPGNGVGFSLVCG